MISYLHLQQSKVKELFTIYHLQIHDESLIHIHEVYFETFKCKIITVSMTYPVPWGMVTKVLEKYLTGELLILLSAVRYIYIYKVLLDGR